MGGRGNREGDRARTNHLLNANMILKKGAGSREGDRAPTKHLRFILKKGRAGPPGGRPGPNKAYFELKCYLCFG